MALSDRSITHYAQPTANGPRVCAGCGGRIAARDVYERVMFIAAGELRILRLHLDCSTPALRLTVRERGSAAVASEDAETLAVFGAAGFSASGETLADAKRPLCDSKPRTMRELVACWPSRRAFCDAVGRTQAVVDGWMYRGAEPGDDSRIMIRKAAAEIGLRLSAADIRRMVAAREAAE